MSTDPIAAMSEQEIRDACIEVLNYQHAQVCEAILVGLIIAKVQSWEQSIVCYSDGYWRLGGDDPCYKSLQVAFLHLAKGLAHWTPPQKVKEEPQTLEERVDALEAKMRVLLPSYGTGNLHAKPQ